MPTYEFRCPNGHEFERFYRKISDAESEVACPECGAAAQRQMSAGAGLLFKGSGFYLTDYGRNAHRTGGGSKGGSGDAGSKGGEGKSESKSGDAGSSGTTSKSESSAPAKKPDSKPGS